jgi:uncharacterized integral membrane protein
MLSYLHVCLHRSILALAAYAVPFLAALPHAPPHRTAALFRAVSCCIAALSLAAFVAALRQCRDIS